MWFELHTTYLQTAPAFGVVTSGDSFGVQLRRGPIFSWFRVCGRFWSMHLRQSAFFFMFQICLRSRRNSSLGPFGNDVWRVERFLACPRDRPARPNPLKCVITSSF